MANRIRSFVLRVLRVPAEPSPPLGAPGSVRIFRAGTNFYRLRLAEWILAQLGAAFGLGFSIVFLFAVEAEIDRAMPPLPAAAIMRETGPAVGPGTAPRAQPTPQERALAPFHQAVRFAAGLPPWVLTIAHLFEIGAILVFIVQLPFTYTAVRLEYEQHWYIVTDRSLRIRHGLVSMLESTMSFANVQQVVVHQGPLQRILGIADVRVQSAGGAGEQHDGKKHGESLHTGVFRGVANATEIRDLILERLRLFRETGLGDCDELRHVQQSHLSTPPDATSANTLAAAREVLAETRALRAALE